MAIASMPMGKLIAGVVIAILAASVIFIGVSTISAVEPQESEGRLGPKGEQEETDPVGTTNEQEANVPDYDSGWVDITDKAGEYFTFIHNLNSTNVTVDVTGKASADGGAHQRYYGLTDYLAGFSRIYGGTINDWANSIIQTSDGGYAVISRTFSFGAGREDAWLIKTDVNGNMQWSQTYGGTDDECGFSLVETDDGGYAIVGYTWSYGAGHLDAWLVKTDASGVMQWNQTYGGKDYDVGVSLLETSDGGYAIAGYTESYGAGVCDVWLIKTDSAGVVQWNQTYGGIDDDFGYSMVETDDGGYAIIGQTLSFGPGRYDVWLVKTDASGVMQWNQTYGGKETDRGFCLVETDDGGYAIVGETGSFGAGNFDVWLVKTDSDGNELWNQTYGGVDYDSGASLVETDDGGYAIVGETDSFGAGGSDVWLIKTDSDGVVQWSHTWGGIDDDSGASLVETDDGGFAIAGYTGSPSAGNSDVWLLKTDVEYGLAWTDSTANSITLYRGVTDIYWKYVRVRIWIID